MNLKAPISRQSRAVIITYNYSKDTKTTRKFLLKLQNFIHLDTQSLFTTFNPIHPNQKIKRKCNFRERGELLCVIVNVFLDLCNIN